MLSRHTSFVLAQALESRRLLTSSLDGGVLTVSGDANANSISVALFDLNTKEVVVTIEHPVPGNDNEVQACLRGPRFDLLERQIKNMLASVRWSS